MAGKYEISTVFKMIDNFTVPMKNISVSSSGFAKQFSNDMRKTEMQIQAAGRAMKTMAGVAAGAGVALAGKTVVDSVKTYIEFEDAVTKAGSKFKDLDVTSSNYGETLEKLQTAAREVGAVTKFSAVDAAGALDKLAMSGMTSEQAMGMLMGTTNLAAAVGLDLTSAVDMATDAMGAFNLVSEDQNEISANMNRIADVVARTTNMANTDMSMWFEAVKSGAPQFTALGGDIETFSASVGILANSGIKGGEAGTALRNIMLRLSAPAKAGANALSELGISVFDSEGKMLPFIDIMKQFETQLDGVADERKAKLLSDIFGVRAIGSFQVLMSAGTDELQRFTNELYNAGGAAETMAGAQMQSFQGMIEQLKSAFQDKQLSLGKAFEVGGAKEALAGLIAYVQNFDITPFANFLTNIMQALPGIIEGLGNVLQFLWNMKDVIGALVIAWGVYKGALIAALVVEKVMGFVTAVQTMMAATQGMTAAQAALNVVMNANPIGIIITAVAALGLGIYELIKHWDSVSAAMSVAWDWIKKIASVIWDSVSTAMSVAWDWIKKIASVIWDSLLVAFENVKNFVVEFQPLLTMLLGPLGMVVNMIVEIVKNFDNIREAFSNGGFIAGIKAIGGTILSSILAPIQKVLQVIAKIPFIGDKVQGGLDMITGIRQNALNSQPLTAPVTQGERTAYTMNETVTEDHVKIDVALDKGLNGTVSGLAPKTSLNLINSGSW